jgi:hypothetical protein
VAGSSDAAAVTMLVNGEGAVRNAGLLSGAQTGLVEVLVGDRFFC